MKMKTILSSLTAFLLLSGSLEAREGFSATTETLLKSTKSWDGEILPAYPAGQPEITILKIIIPPGARLPMHKHPVINAGVLLKGELTVTTDKGEVVELKSGDPLIEVVGKWHYGANHGNVPAEILVIYAGVEGKPNTVYKE